MSICIDHERTGNLTKEGYAKKEYKGKDVRLHRLVYCLANNISLLDIKDLLVLHTCDNPRCINTDHLYLGSQKDNMRDKVFRKRTHNRKFTDDKIISIRSEYKNKGKTQRQLAIENNVSLLTISRIVNYKTYYEL